MFLVPPSLRLNHNRSGALVPLTIFVLQESYEPVILRKRQHQRLCKHPVTAKSYAEEKQANEEHNGISVAPKPSNVFGHAITRPLRFMATSPILIVVGFFLAVCMYFGCSVRCALNRSLLKVHIRDALSLPHFDASSLRKRTTPSRSLQLSIQQSRHRSFVPRTRSRVPVRLPRPSARPDANLEVSHEEEWRGPARV